MFPVTITVDAARPIGEMRPIFRFFGADEPNYATMRDGEKLLDALGRWTVSMFISVRTTC